MVFSTSIMAFIDYFAERPTVSHDFGGATNASGMDLRLISVHHECRWLRGTAAEWLPASRSPPP
jgi:hypothetical protein